MTAKKSTSTDTPTDQPDGFSVEERDAIKERARELRATRGGPKAGKADGTDEVLAKFAEMPDEDRALGERLHAIIMAAAPELSPKLWYGMPAYAKNGKVVCFFQNAAKFKTRYSTLGFNDSAQLDDGTLWPTAYALTELTPAAEQAIAALIKKAVA